MLVANAGLRLKIAGQLTGLCCPVPDTQVHSELT